MSCPCDNESYALSSAIFICGPINRGIRLMCEFWDDNGENLKDKYLGISLDCKLANVNRAISKVN